MRSLIVNKPDDPVKFLIDKLEKPESKSAHPPKDGRLSEFLNREGVIALCRGRTHLSITVSIFSDPHRPCGPSWQQEKGDRTGSVGSFQRGRQRFLVHLSG